MGVQTKSSLRIAHANCRGSSEGRQGPNIAAGTMGINGEKHRSPCRRNRDEGGSHKAKANNDARIMPDANMRARALESRIEERGEISRLRSRASFFTREKRERERVRRNGHERNSNVHLRIRHFEGSFTARRGQHSRISRNPRVVDALRFYIFPRT